MYLHTCVQDLQELLNSIIGTLAILESLIYDRSGLKIKN